MHSVCFKIGFLTINWFGVMLAMGFLAGLGNWILLGRKEGRDFTFCSDLLFWIIVAGIVGARVAYVFSDLKEFMDRPVTIFFIHRGGLIFYGGFVAAALALVVFARVYRQKFLALVDFVITSVPLAHVFGRIGCFLNGCCHGRVHDGLLSVTFPKDSLPWDNQLYAGRIGKDALHTLPVHPVQLYEAAFNLLLYVFLFQAYRRRKTDGKVTSLYLLIYPVFRFFVEFLRGDERIKWMGMSVAQVMSIVLLVTGIIVWLVSCRNESPASEHN